MPPHVEYTLTTMGRTLLGVVGGLVTWAEHNLDQIDAARAGFDARAARTGAPG